MRDFDICEKCLRADRYIVGLNPSKRWLEIKITVKEQYPPIILTDYALKSSGEDRKAPAYFSLIPLKNGEYQMPLHTDNQVYWTEVWQWREFKIENRETPYRQFVLRILSDGMM